MTPQFIIRPRRGFTLVEMLIVVGVILSLMMLLLPAVQQSREAARRVQCQNNLLQLGLALANYHDAHLVLPPGTVNASGPVRHDTRDAYLFSWTVRILPQLEQANLYRAFDFNRSVFDPANAPLHADDSYMPKVFMCPSDGSWTKTSSPNYAGCHHAVSAPIDSDNSGVLFLNSSIRLNRIPDGRRSTILLGETYSIIGHGWAVGTRATLRNTGEPLLHGMPIRTRSGQLAGPQGDTVITPATAQTPAVAPDPSVFDVGGFGSCHSVGAHFVFCDGSVRMVSTSIDDRIYHNLANRADGAVVSAF